jgi:outer membrane protein OmpA-like peptidoglycan-associated protein
MAESVAEREPARRPEDPFDELRSLIIGPEQRELLELHSHLNDSTLQTQAVASVLPDAFALRARDPKLSGAVAPMVEDAITASVRRNPQPLADALFPVIGPAIRKAIQHTLASMMESFNRSVEHSVSWRALRWRVMAWRTGKPFAEIVLLQTLEYRVEQVFLIHAESGLLLQQASVAGAAAQDADQVSAMLTAIRDFARDSFNVAGNDSIEGLRIGDMDVLVEQGPLAILAAVVRGTPPQSLRAVFQEALESVHRQFAPEIRAFRGDASSLAPARPLLDACLVSQARAPKRRTVFRPVLVVATLLLLAIGVWSFLRWRDTQRWNAYLERLNAEPGIAVLASGRRGGRFFVAGLRDPLARDPAALVAGTELSPASIDSRWEPYQGLHPAFVTARAADLLKPPPGVTLAFQDGTLTASGSASERWIAESERWAPAVAGVRQFHHAGPDPATVLQQRLEAATILFARGESRIEPDQQVTLSQIRTLLAELDDTLAVRGRRATVQIHGFTDIDGPDALNATLSQSRANVVIAAIDAREFASIDFSARGEGSSVPAGPGNGESAKERDRRVSLHVVFADGARGSGIR